MFQKILFCADGSDCSLEAAETAAQLAQKFGGSVILLNVFDSAIAVAPFVGVWEAAISEQTLLSHQTEIQDAILKRTVPVFESAGVAFEEIREWGSPSEKIISVAEHAKADLIVMGSRGLGGFASLLLGSVSDRVLHHAKCPVLIVR